MSKRSQRQRPREACFLREFIDRRKTIVGRACRCIAGDATAGAVLLQIIERWRRAKKNLRNAPISLAASRSQPAFFKSEGRYWFAKEWEYWQGYSRGLDEFDRGIAKLEGLGLISIAVFSFGGQSETYISLRPKRLRPALATEFSHDAEQILNG